MPKRPIASRAQSKKYQSTQLRAAKALKQTLLIWEALRAEPMRAPELAKKLNMASANVHNRLRRLNLIGFVRPLKAVKIGRAWSYPWAVDEKALERALAEGATSKTPISAASNTSPAATTSSEETQAGQ